MSDELEQNIESISEKRQTNSNFSWLSFFGWLFGLVFLASALVNLFKFELIVSLTSFIPGILILPPVSKNLFSKGLSEKAYILSVIAAFTMFGLTVDHRANQIKEATNCR